MKLNEKSRISRDQRVKTQ